MRGVVVVALAALVCCAAGFSTVGPITIDGTAYDFEATVFVGGIPDNGAVGPVGITWDSQNNTYISYYATHELTKWAPDVHGNPSGTTLVWRTSTQPYGFYPCGFAFSKSGDLYVGFQGSGSILKVDMATGLVDPASNLVARVGSPGGGITALINDPKVGDIFYEDLGGAVYRITGTGVGETPAFYTYLSWGCGIDGLYFDSAGTIYMAACGQIVTAPYSSGSTTASAFASVSTVDGTAASDALVLGNRNDGIVTAVSKATKAQYNVFTGGSRGDLAGVGPDGCFYFTQTDSVVKLTTLPGGVCNLSSSVAPVEKCGGANCATKAVCGSLTSAEVVSTTTCASLSYNAC